MLTAAYVLAFGAMTWTAGFAIGDLGPIWSAAAGYAAATIVIFIFSVAYDNSSVYDPFWSVAPVALALWGWIVLGPPQDPIRGCLALGMTSWWGARLTYNWWRGWPGMHHEDWRYVDFRRKTGRAYWLVSFAGIHGFPSVQTFLGSIPLMFAVSEGGGPLGWLDGLAAVVVATAIALETIADRQLHDFVAGERAPGDVLEAGLWAHSRHPNYFGEVMFWWGLWLFALSAGAPLWTVAGAASITAMFLLVSLPLMERRMIARRPHYADVQRRVSILVPWLRRDR